MMTRLPKMPKGSAKTTLPSLAAGTGSARYGSEVLAHVGLFVDFDPVMHVGTLIPEAGLGSRAGKALESAAPQHGGCGLFADFQQFPLIGDTHFIVDADIALKVAGVVGNKLLEDIFLGVKETVADIERILAVGPFARVDQHPVAGFVPGQIARDQFRGKTRLWACRAGRAKKQDDLSPLGRRKAGECESPSLTPVMAASSETV